MSTSALALRVNRQLLRAIGDTLDGVKIAICVFDDEDRSVFWNRTFLEVFPEHVGKVYEGEPYRENLHRFYTARLNPTDLPNIEQFISMGIDRHHSQMRPYSFDHRGQRVHVSSLPLPSGQRVRIWNAEKRHHSELPTQALATNTVVVSEETATLLGKVGIPDNILLKPGRLNDDEWAIMKTHALIGENTLAATKHDKERSHLLSVAKNIAGGHHEWWNGEGYPRGLQGQQIPLEARIMAIADVYDALVSERVYKENWTHDEAVQFILEKKKIQFDPLVVDAFLCESDTCNQIAQTFRD
jgi:hypothetical protein